MGGKPETLIEYVARGRYVDVALTQKVARVLQSVEVRSRAKLERWMKLYADEGRDNIPGENIKNEGRHAALGKEHSIWAFRAGTTRLYGGLVANLFLVTEIDDKKRRKADPAVLQRAAKALSDYVPAEGRKGG